ncbi:exported hypothetical protein [metagenome]
MNGNFFGVAVLGIFGICIIFLFTSTGHGDVIATTPIIQKIDTLHVDDLTGYGIRVLNLKNADSITAPALTFITGIPCGDDVNIFFYDGDGVLIGTGTENVTSCPTDLTITISPMADTVSTVERATLASVTITVT